MCRLENAAGGASPSPARHRPGARSARRERCLSIPTQTKREMTMRHLKWKLLFAGVLVACVFGGIAIGVAWATPGVGVTNTPLAGPVALDEIHIVDQSPTHGIILKTRADW